MTAFTTILFEKDRAVARIILNRPDVLNAFNTQMRDDLWQALNAIQADAEIRAVIFSGAGKAFCAGADLSEFLSAPSPVIAREVRRERDIWRLLINLPQPTIASLHSYVIGSGIELALGCDIRIGAENARFALPETGLGFIPGAGATQLLPRMTGESMALRMILSGLWLNSQEARYYGLINHVFSLNRLESETIKIASRLARLPPSTVSYIKAAVIRGGETTLSQALLLERRLASITYPKNPEKRPV